MQEKMHEYILLYNLIQPFVECNVKVLIKIKHVDTPWPRNLIPWNLSQRNICTHKQWYKHKSGYLHAFLYNVWLCQLKEYLKQYLEKLVWYKVKGRVYLVLVIYFGTAWSFVINKTKK